MIERSKYHRGLSLAWVPQHLRGEVGGNGDDGKPIFREEWLFKLADRDINGRQIENATRTASSLATSRKEPLGYRHLVETLDVMEEFTAEFKAMSATSE